MPIVRISQAARNLSEGGVLRVFATDPAFRADLLAWVEMTGNELVEFSSDDSEQQAVLRIG